MVSPELNRIEMVWKQMKYNWRDFKVMKADQIEHWVGNISKGFGNEYMFTFYLILSPIFNCLLPVDIRLWF